MHLVLGYPNDSCCTAVAARFEALGLSVCRLDAAFAEPARFSLDIDATGRATATLALAEDRVEQVESVLVRSSGAIDPAGWDAADHAYMQAETQAAALAWLAALDCPVVNGANAELWYRPRKPLLYWRSLLNACGIRVPDILITSNAADLQRFRAKLEAAGVPGAICRSLARHEDWLVGLDDWTGVAALQRYAPVCLAEPHATVTLLCIVGNTVIWGAEPLPAASALSEKLVQFARCANLGFVEIAVAEVRTGLAVVHVDPVPMLEHFSSAASIRIVDALTDLLAGQAHERRKEMVS